MKISEKIMDIVTEAEAKALGTLSNEGIINVVPISMVKVETDAIYIFNFFMDKTLENIQSNNNVSFTCWGGLTGIQIKGLVEYTTEGEKFAELVTWVKNNNPDRLVIGALKIIPLEIFDIGPTKDIDPKDLQLS